MAGITTDAPLGSISGAGVSLTGPLTAAGVVGKIDLASVDGGSLTLGGTAARGTTAITVGGLSNATLTASVPVASITVKGNVSQSGLTFTAPGVLDLGKLTVTGSLLSSQVVATGSIGSVTAASSTGSTIDAGLTLAGGAALPTTAAEFTAPSAVNSVTFKTDAGTDIAASTLGKLNLGALTVSNGGTHFGVAAHTLASLTARPSTGGRINLRRVTSAATLSTQLAKNKVNLTGTDLTIGII